MNTIDVMQLDLFRGQGEILAELIVRDIVDAVLEAGANLSTVDIQLAIGTARERAIDLLNSQFPHHADHQRDGG
jgi:hypothetical protein